MNDRPPSLKSNWERFKQPIPVDRESVKPLISSYCDDKIMETVLLSEGCVNSNYKIIFETQPPVLLRIYSRDQETIAREIALHDLLSDDLPVPKILYSNDRCDHFAYPYVIMEYIEGELMRNVLMTNNPVAIKDCAYDAGLNITKLREYHLSHSGFFQADFSIRPFSEDEQYLTFALNCIASATVQTSLGSALANQIKLFLEAHSDLLPDQNSANLTHGDYDPSNLLVRQIDGNYKIVGILDWEYAFSGTYLFDIGAFLRYSHRLPSIYQQAFAQGLGDLPTHRLAQAKYIDLINLLSLLHWNPKSERPNLANDVTQLITETINSDHFD